MGKSHLGGHDMVRRVDRQGRRCSGYERQRMGPTLKNIRNRWRRKQANTSSKTRSIWCNGGASIRKKLTTCGNLSEMRRNKCRKHTKWRSTREEHTKEEVSRQSGGWSRESRNINLENGVKTAGRESSRGSGNTICSEIKACRRAKRKRKR